MASGCPDKAVFATALAPCAPPPTPVEPSRPRQHRRLTIPAQPPRACHYPHRVRQ
jgi:hypothetical protein